MKNNYISLLTALALLLAGCAGQAMPPVHKYVPDFQTNIIDATVNNCIVPTNCVGRINFYSAAPSDTSWTLVGSVSVPVGGLSTNFSPDLIQPWNSTRLYTTESTNELTHQFSDFSMVITNTSPPPPASALIVPSAGLRQK
jgi:hypothetical protein